MTTFDPVEVRKAVAEFTPRRPQKFQVVEKSLAAVTIARIVPLRFTSRALVTSLYFQDSNEGAGLPSALGGGRCAPAPLALLAGHRPKPDNSYKQAKWWIRQSMIVEFRFSNRWLENWSHSTRQPLSQLSGYK
jgi:hypothetical protein